MSQELIKTFDRTVVLFNEQKWDQLAPLLDKDVTAVGIDHPLKHHYKGPTEVLKFLRDYAGAQFRPHSEQQILARGRSGLVAGIAHWKDPGDGDNALIIYDFAFINRATPGAPPQWLLLRLGSTHAD